MKITVKIRAFFEKMARVHLRRNFAILSFCFGREEQDLEIWFITKVHVINLK
jgi:hypothetical protein